MRQLLAEKYLEVQQEAVKVCQTEAENHFARAILEIGGRARKGFTNMNFYMPTHPGIESDEGPDEDPMVNLVASMLEKEGFWVAIDNCEFYISWSKESGGEMVSTGSSKC